MTFFDSGSPSFFFALEAAVLGVTDEEEDSAEPGDEVYERDDIDSNGVNYEKERKFRRR